MCCCAVSKWVFSAGRIAIIGFLFTAHITLFMVLCAFSSSNNGVRAVCIGKWLWMGFRSLRVGKDNVLKMSQPLYNPGHFLKECKEQGSASLSLQNICSMNCLYQWCIAKLKCFHFVIKNNLNITSMFFPQQKTRL